MSDNKFVLTIIVLTIGLLVVILAANRDSSGSSVDGTLARERCIQHQNLATHIHVQLAIWIDNQPVPIPEFVGIQPSCMKPLHTHDGSGTIHIEYTEPHDFTLGDFFATWGQPFSATRLMNRTVDETHILIMTVNGQSSSDFENLILRNDQKIELRFAAK